MNLFNNALLFAPQNISLLVIGLAGGAWLVLLAILLSDLFASRLGTVWKVVWVPLLLGLPGLGGVIYGSFWLMFSLAQLRHSK